jgi:hypothetical protein
MLYQSIQECRRDRIEIPVDHPSLHSLCGRCNGRSAICGHAGHNVSGGMESEAAGYPFQRFEPDFNICIDKEVCFGIGPKFINKLIIALALSGLG